MLKKDCYYFLLINNEFFQSEAPRIFKTTNHASWHALRNLEQLGFLTKVNYEKKIKFQLTEKGLKAQIALKQFTNLMTHETANQFC